MLVLAFLMVASPVAFIAVACTWCVWLAIGHLGRHIVKAFAARHAAVRFSRRHVDMDNWGSE